MKINIITGNECFNMDSETGSVIRNTNVMWNFANCIFYIEQDGALRLPEDNDYVINFDPNDLKAGDFIFVSYRIAGKIHIVRLRDENLTKLINIFKEERNKQKEDSEPVSCSGCSDECCDSGDC